MIITQEDEIKIYMDKWGLTRAEAKKYLGVRTGMISRSEIKEIVDKYCREEGLNSDRRKNKATQNKTKNISARIS